MYGKSSKSNGIGFQNTVTLLIRFLREYCISLCIFQGNNGICNIGFTECIKYAESDYSFLFLLNLLYFLLFHFDQNIIPSLFKDESLVFLSIAMSIHNTLIKAWFQYYRIDSRFISFFLHNCSSIFIFLWCVWIKLNICILNWLNIVIFIFDLHGLIFSYKFDMTKCHCLRTECNCRCHVVFSALLL